MIKYQLTEKDIKKYLKQKRKITNIFFIALGTIIYFYITFYLIYTNPLETFAYYLLYLIILIVFILIFNELYCRINIKKNKNNIGNYNVKINSDKLIVEVNNNTYEYLKSNIKKIKNNKRYILIKYNNNLSLLFIKEKIKRDDYKRIELIG